MSWLASVLCCAWALLNTFSCGAHAIDSVILPVLDPSMVWGGNRSYAGGAYPWFQFATRADGSPLDQCTHRCRMFPTSDMPH